MIAPCRPSLHQTLQLPLDVPLATLAQPRLYSKSAQNDAMQAGAGEGAGEGAECER